MTLDMVNLVWSAMIESELYSPSDLANRLGQPDYAVARVLEFLTRYGFAQQITKSEPIFRRVVDAPAPGDAVRILQTVLEDDADGHAERVAAFRARATT